MLKDKRFGGYTIVEVLIFVAVSGFMFAMAATFVSGKQDAAQFRDGVTEMASKIQRTINDVNNGYYPDKPSTPFTCVVDNVGASSPTFTAGSPSDKQGTHLGCVFLGKVYHFQNDSTNYKIYTVAGRQYKTSATDGKVATSFSEAKPNPINVGSFDLTESNQTKWSINVIKIVNIPNTGPSQQLQGFGFYGSFAGYTGSSLQSASQDVNVAVYPGTSNQANLDTDIRNTTEVANIVSNPNIKICLSDGKRYATITVGGTQGQTLSTKSTFYASLPPGC